MSQYDAHGTAGQMSVAENARRLANYRYLEIQLMEMLAGWSMTTPALAHKAAFGYHVYDHAQAADLLGERLGQLRSWSERHEPPNDEFARLCERVWELESLAERLAALYLVLEPHLVSTYVYHAEACDPLADAPTQRLLRRLAGTAQSHVAWGRLMLDSLAPVGEAKERLLALQAELEAELVACGGVTGSGIEVHWLAFSSAPPAESAPPRKVRRKSGGYRFAKRCPSRDHPAVEAPFWFSDDPAEFDRAYAADDQWSLPGYRGKFHQLLYGEVETTDRMGKMLAEFPELPWQMRMDLALQMWDEARHIEIVAKACQEEMGGELGYGPWPLVWWWMQNEADAFHRIAVTNGWAEANLMSTLREWREHAEQRGYTRIAELCDYLQADEMNHVRLVNRWAHQLTGGDSQRMAEAVAWGTAAVERIQRFYARDPGWNAAEQGVRFSFLRSDEIAALGWAR
jgi:hypothetical protein